VNYRKYRFSDNQAAKFSQQVFVAMHTTRQLAWYTLHEPWGDKNSLLFKYLDYTFRCAAFRDEIYCFEEKLYHYKGDEHPINTLSTDHGPVSPSSPMQCDEDEDGKSSSSSFEVMSDDQRNGINRQESRLIFNTGLCSRQSGRTVYLMLTPNQKKSVAQSWRVNYGDPYNRYNSSFVTDEWLLHNVIPDHGVGDPRDLLPKRFMLNEEVFDSIRRKFQKNKLQIEADFNHIVTKYWDRIVVEYLRRNRQIITPSKEETTKLLKKAFDEVRKDRNRHKLLTPMLYVDSHNMQHSVEYIVPLRIEVPAATAEGCFPIWFAAALVSRERNHAQLMSILSAEMAYSNARLMGRVEIPWLKGLAPCYHKLHRELAPKMSPILKVYHLEQAVDAVEVFLYETFAKYGPIISVDLSLVSSPNVNNTEPSDKFSASIHYANAISVIDAYNGTMDMLNRGQNPGYELDFELLAEAEARERRELSTQNQHVHLQGHGRGPNCNGCRFSTLFNRPHVLPPPDQWLGGVRSSNRDLFYPPNPINKHPPPRTPAAPKKAVKSSPRRPTSLFIVPPNSQRRQSGPIKISTSRSDMPPIPQGPIRTRPMAGNLLIGRPDDGKWQFHQYSITRHPHQHQQKQPVHTEKILNDKHHRGNAHEGRLPPSSNPGGLMGPTPSGHGSHGPSTHHLVRTNRSGGSRVSMVRTNTANLVRVGRIERMDRMERMDRGSSGRNSNHYNQRSPQRLTSAQRPLSARGMGSGSNHGNSTRRYSNCISNGHHNSPPQRAPHQYNVVAVSPKRYYNNYHRAGAHLESVSNAQGIYHHLPVPTNNGQGTFFRRHHLQYGGSSPPHHGTHYANYRMLSKTVSEEWQELSDSLRSFGINSSYIQCMRRCINPNHHRNGASKKGQDKKATTDTALWYQTTPNLAVQIATNGFIFKYMTDFSQLMDTSGFKFETNPRVNNKTIVEATCNETHVFQCRLRLTDKQLGYLRHNGSIIITDTRIISPAFWIVLSKK